MKPSLTITSESHAYPVYIHQGLRHSTYELIEQSLMKPASAYMIIADETVADLYLRDVLASFPDNRKPSVALVPSGEASKSLDKYEELLTKTLEARLDRQSVIIALGGGVTGDLAGFVAASYMRGIRFVQLPSTLLAHDSSVGGKTGINHPLGKNLIGAFHPPSAVVYDSEMLMTMPEKEWRSGFAEVVKHGFIADPPFLQWLQENVPSFSSCSLDTINELLKRSIAVKAKIVQEDEREQGVRAYLNFGHTLAHSIEAESGYGTITHGEAVAIGMVFALKLSEQVYDIDLQYADTIRYMESLGYHLSIPNQCDSHELLNRMKIDKKTHNQKVHYVLLKELGRPELVPVDDHVILQLLTGGVGNK
ncbi:3-dehydroquinate synthase [Salipaludibacillus keqinensis]|uniref:3-dehydroquinate synthase n=1 Tax=Salipaludibacillus keqinensis TaxID=2045207 RepID=A0A323TPD4_9BACI|nr:3-dehydroquinate synthase [Salipaludibacillus keqinensis]PYZ94513.1 3-dehydroquinate synthase [Salipaludibacillus keqinensis]